MKTQKGIILGVVAILTVTFYIGYNAFEAQAAKDLSGIPPNEQRFIFQKDFQDYLELNSIERSAAFPDDLRILNWDQLSQQTRNTIIQEASKAGYSVITP